MLNRETVNEMLAREKPIVVCVRTRSGVQYMADDYGADAAGVMLRQANVYDVDGEDLDAIASCLVPYEAIDGIEMSGEEAA